MKRYKKALGRYQNLSKKEKKKICEMVVNVRKISQKMENKSLLNLGVNFHFLGWIYFTFSS